ncbi:uncharacterized protein [Typha angustifolia]|uniref:uncharacterized protein n=1 Tax=Typha angustifolia TaxID=59011 RepID=UPI003C2E3A9D
MGKVGGGGARQNAIRSGIVVVGAIAFGYLSFRVGFKPYLDRAQEAMDLETPPDPSHNLGGEQQLPYSEIPISVFHEEDKQERTFKPEIRSLRSGNFRCQARGKIDAHVLLFANDLSHTRHNIALHLSSLWYFKRVIHWRSSDTILL